MEVGIPACWGFTHSCTLNNNNNDDNVVVIFAVVNGRGVHRWSVGILGASGDGGGLTQLAHSPFFPIPISLSSAPHSLSYYSPSFCPLVSLERGARRSSDGVWSRLE